MSISDPFPLVQLKLMVVSVFEEILSAVGAVVGSAPTVGSLAVYELIFEDLQGWLVLRV